jgi:hypothetical protein
MRTDDEAVALSVFTYQIDHRALKRDQQIYFLRLENNQDPDPNFITRLKEKKYPIKAGSQSERSKGFIQDKETRAFGILLSIRNRTCVSSELCDVQAAIYENSDNSEVWQYKVARENDLWVVKKAELISIT